MNCQFLISMAIGICGLVLKPDSVLGYKIMFQPPSGAAAERKVISMAEEWLRCLACREKHG